MPSHFNPQFFQANRQRLRASVEGGETIVVIANGLLQRGGDSAYSFFQDANFWYLTGLDEPDLILVMESDAEYLIVPSRDHSRTTFDGAVDEKSMCTRSGIRQILDTTGGLEKLTANLKKSQKVATVTAAPAYIESMGMFVNPARAYWLKKLNAAVPNLSCSDISAQIVSLRMIKQPAELTALQSAINVTLATIKQATSPARLAKYRYEYQLEAELHRGFRSRGAAGHAFDPIVAGGDRACTLHNVANNSAFTPGELVVIDIGAEVEHYAADVTRTVCIGTPSQRARQIHSAVQTVQRFAFGLLRPGVLLADFEHKIEQFMGEQLLSLGLITTNDHDSVRRYFPHATSHFLGLNVHDAGDYLRPLEPGMVITVEPGIYIPSESIGVRIEDDVLITHDGIDILSKGLSATLA